MVERKNGQLARRLAITNCHLPLLIRIGRQFGGKIHTHVPVGQWRRHFQWYCYGATMIELLQGVLPYLIVKRKEAQLCLAFDVVRKPQAKPGQPLTARSRQQYRRLLKQVDELRRRAWTADDIPRALRASRRKRSSAA